MVTTMTQMKLFKEEEECWICGCITEDPKFIGRNPYCDSCFAQEKAVPEDVVDMEEYP